MANNPPTAVVGVERIRCFQFTNGLGEGGHSPIPGTTDNSQGGLLVGVGDGNILSQVGVLRYFDALVTHNTNSGGTGVNVNLF